MFGKMRRMAFRNSIFLVLFAALSFGCASLSLKRQLKSQLSEGGKYSVEILWLNVDEKTAGVKVRDKSKFIDLQGIKENRKYKHDGQVWKRID